MTDHLMSILRDYIATRAFASDEESIKKVANYFLNTVGPRVDVEKDRVTAELLTNLASRGVAALVRAAKTMTTQKCFEKNGVHNYKIVDIGLQTLRTITANTFLVQCAEHAAAVTTKWKDVAPVHHMVAFLDVLCELAMYYTSKEHCE
jgi:hypothetical protein